MTSDPQEPGVASVALGTPPALLFVHAHPDDETQTTGGTISHYVDLGCRVCVVTCTQGEEGRIGVPELAHLAADRDDALGAERSRELSGAMEALGVTDHRYLVRQGRYRDSGRFGRASNLRGDAFWQADLDEAASWLARVIRELRPVVVVTYDDNGGYGHPDHIQTHRVTMRAIDLAGDPSRPNIEGQPWSTPSVFWTAVPRSHIVREIDQWGQEIEGQDDLWIDTDPDHYPDGVHDDFRITTDLDVSDTWSSKVRALRCHRTQLSVHGSYWALASGRAMRIQDHEWYMQVRPVPYPGLPLDHGLLPSALETQLLLGLDAR